MYYTHQLVLDRTQFQAANAIQQYPIEIPSSKGNDIVGIKVYEVGDKTNEYSIGLQAHDKDVQEVTYKEDWLRLTEQTRTKDVDIQNIRGRKVLVNVKSELAFTGDTTLHLVFVMR